ncbi:MAG TPA: VCBS repeat-containing protein [Gemmatimonadaceae bacterium]|nr:VCBS repeat-containing protein [Gemmatimonadaceae bacterium]
MRRRIVGWHAALLLAGGAVAACHRSDPPPLFEQLDARRTGVAFENRLPEDTAFNPIDYLYYYNGGGVAAGDVDGDGRPDLYFTANVGPNRLYLNKGDYHFEDVTDRAGVAGPEGWKTGVTMADVDGDGRLDLYVSAVSYLTMHGRNILYVNKGDGTFADRTKEFGLEHVGYSTQALFFDYDLDGDVDMYLLNHSVHTERGVSAHPQREPRHPRAGDKLFRNDGGRFTDVSAQAGIYGGVEGYGLGVVASDFDLDGCPDLYVANDFQENDFLYHNDCDGTFTESIATATGHTSRFSMGADAADFDNDGRPDLVTLDMLPEREEILKTAASAESYDLFQARVRAGYHPQLARNALQLNRGGMRFSDVAYLAGVAATDWSWAPLFADFDNDGRKDLFITSGIYRRPNDLDYIAYVGNEAVQATLARGAGRDELALLQRMPRVPLPNHAFRNTGNLGFANMGETWGLAQPGFSNGAVYADLNGSGALDLIVNNVNAPAAIYRNHARARNGNHYLRIDLRGNGANTLGVGAKVYVRTGPTRQLLEQQPTRGFQSSVDPRLHFGLGAAAKVDSLVVIWPDRRFEVRTNVAVDGTVILAQADARGRWEGQAPPVQPLLEDVTAASGVDFRHVENAFVDFDREPLMPHMLSTEGPALAVGDVDRDGLDDFYVGGAKWQPGRLYRQSAAGTFHLASAPALAADSVAEDVDATFFDADSDGDLDLYVVSGGNEFWGDQEPLLDRLYLNDGRGGFQRAPSALPALFDNGSCAVPGDFDGDGDLDLFVGARVVARRYGVPPRSHLLENDGRGHFTDVTMANAPALASVGMVTSAAALDYDGDGRLDLAVVGEWMPITLFHQENGRLVDRTREMGLARTKGWWNDVRAADLDGDGRPDLVAGNLGLNSYVRASAREPARMYVGDFLQDGVLEQIITFYRNGVSYPVAGRDEIVRAFPQLRRRYPSYASFGASRLEDILPAAERARATVLEASTFASVIARNGGASGFTLDTLPVAAQLAPMRASLNADLDGDGHADLLLGGNFYGVPPLFGRSDASHSVFLRGGGAGRYSAVDIEAGAPIVDGQIRRLALARGAGGSSLVIVARNDDRLLVLRPGSGGHALLAHARR